MSLTSFIKIPEVKLMFRKEFPLVSKGLQGEIKAPPVTKNYPLVGTAFDYLFRFYLEQENLNCVTTPWVAESSLAVLNHEIDRLGKKTSREMRDVSDQIALLLHDAKESYESYMHSGKLDDELIRNSIVLAQIDVFYRSGMMHPSLGKIDDGDVKDLRNLISLVKPETFKAKKACFLNPTFGYGSELVGGADADLIVDDLLIDLKTTKYLSFTQEQYNQLIGYYILSKLGKINESEDVSISKIGIYFSRHGILHTISAKEIEEHPNFPKFVGVFEKLATVVFKNNEENSYE